jgi:hypothetical protein
VLVGDDLPELGTDLVTALTRLDVDDFAHVGRQVQTLGKSNGLVCGGSYMLMGVGFRNHEGSAGVCGGLHTNHPQLGCDRSRFVTVFAPNFMLLEYLMHSP